ncbi:probable ubiquitin-like-specific protease 2A [Corylus avellana]|uniref:probable ubiquitin-like-specific protease 2A n=1 Tax=Corylus avellana TaxID=13451 RepID=UPI00286ABBF9|nr:probable ubiquitin-like-specific protease 2A [Corylus avellana]
MCRKLWGSFSEDKRTSFTYLDCLWFHLYRRQPYKAKVLTWIKNKHIFSKKYVLVPIICWDHWSLLIFCHFGESLQSKTRTPCMLLLDSLLMANPRWVEPDIRKFVLDIYKAEGRPENEDFIYRIPLLVPKVPQQTGNQECGSFVLYFSKLFVEGTPEDFRVEDYPYFVSFSWLSCLLLQALHTINMTTSGNLQSFRPKVVCEGVPLFVAADDSLMASLAVMNFTLPVSAGFCLLEYAYPPELGPTVCIPSRQPISEESNVIVLIIHFLKQASGKTILLDRHDSQVQFFVLSLE